MRRLGLLVGVCVFMLAISVGNASAFTGGGRAPSAAPLITYGQPYVGELDNHNEDANYVTGVPSTVAIYKVPPVSTRDQLTVNWQETPFVHESGFPIRMFLLQGVNDFNWGEIFGKVAYNCCGEAP